MTPWVGKGRTWNEGGEVTGSQEGRRQQNIPVNPYIVMARVVQDKRAFRLIRASFEAGVMENGVCARSEAGTP